MPRKLSNTVYRKTNFKDMFIIQKNKNTNSNIDGNNTNTNHYKG